MAETINKMEPSILLLRQEKEGSMAHLGATDGCLLLRKIESIKTGFTFLPTNNTNLRIKTQDMLSAKCVELTQNKVKAKL